MPIAATVEDAGRELGRVGVAADVFETQAFADSFGLTFAGIGIAQALHSGHDAFAALEGTLGASEELQVFRLSCDEAVL